MNLDLHRRIRSKVDLYFKTRRVRQLLRWLEWLEAVCGATAAIVLSFDGPRWIAVVCLLVVIFASATCLLYANRQLGRIRRQFDELENRIANGQ